MAPCIVLRHSSHVVTQRHSTTGYEEIDRRRLGDAVMAARQAAGYTSQELLAMACQVSLRSISKAENGEKGAGKKTLFAIGRVLPGWTEYTATAILEGAQPPDIVDGPVAGKPQYQETRVNTANLDDLAFWAALEEELREYPDRYRQYRLEFLELKARIEAERARLSTQVNLDRSRNDHAE